jgi:hypothetical protein
VRRLLASLGQRDEGFVTPGPTPAVAFNAADQPLAVVIDLDQRAVAVGAVAHGVAVQ